MVMQLTQTRPGWLRENGGTLLFVAIMVALPFLFTFRDGQSFSAMLDSQNGYAKFMQGLLIEVMILALYAISYDLILGVTGLLSFGHAMFFAVGAYGAGILLKSFGWGFWPTVAGVLALGVAQALLFGLVLWRVQGITFALVTLGIASMFHIIIQSNELVAYTGADVGLQGVVSPPFLNTSTERFRFYIVTLCVLTVVWLIYRRFVDSPTGRVCLAIRENENRALMLGYNTLWFKVTALLISSLTAVTAGLLHTLHQPIVSPNTAGLGFTVAALLMILMGGVGTLSGALVGAAIYRLMQFYLERWFGPLAHFLIGAVYILLVMFLPFGIVGTWRLRRMEIERGRQWLARLVGGRKGN
jgi:branched-chain amino acid transport system permease protein